MLLFHKFFEWDESKAAFHYRLQQARTILNNIEVTVITDGEPRQIAVFEITTRSEGYKSITTLTSEDVDYIRESTARQLTTMRDKLRTYKSFKRVISYLTKAIDAI